MEYSFFFQLSNYGVNNSSKCFSYEGLEAVARVIAGVVQRRRARGGGVIANGSHGRSPSFQDSIATPSLHGTSALPQASLCHTLSENSLNVLVARLVVS